MRAPTCCCSGRRSRTRSSGSRTAATAGSWSPTGGSAMTGGVGIAAEWMGDADGPDHWRDTHVRVRGPVVRGLQGAFAENWLEGTGEVLAGDEYLPELEPVDDGGPMQLVRSSAKVGDTNAEALYYLAIASAQQLDRAHRRLLRPAAGVHRRPLRCRRARRRRAHPGPRPAHRQGRRPGRRPGRLRRAARGGGARLRVPADDAAREDALRRRRLVVGGHDQLRQPLVSAPRRGHALRLGPALRRRARRGVRRATSSARTRSTPGAGTSASLRQRAGEAATAVLRREL